MRKITTGMLLLLGSTLYAQQKPHYTQYILNQYIINPALTGIENYTDIKLSHRHQWVGVQDAPVTTYLSAHMPIGKQDYRSTATSFDLSDESPRGQRYWDEYSAAAPHHGIGLQVINDRTGPLNYFSAYATYAYHIGISARTSLAAGFGAGLSNIRLNTTKLNFGTTQVDPAVYNSSVIDNIRPDFSAGLYLYSADYFLGFSAQQIIKQRIDFSGNTIKTSEGNTVPHLFATAGYRFLVGENFNFIPSVLVKYIQPLSTQVDVNAKLQFRNIAWLGASYRHEDGFAAMLGVNINNKINIGYAYDYTTSGLNIVSKGTHEILLGFIIGKTEDGCPKNVW